ncbi:hypothetical protein TIFTF001_053404, partial [Ficus carica]
MGGGGAGRGGSSS